MGDDSYERQSIARTPTCRDFASANPFHAEPRRERKAGHTEMREVNAGIAGRTAPGGKLPLSGGATQRCPRPGLPVFPENSTLFSAFPGEMG